MVTGEAAQRESEAGSVLPSRSKALGRPDGYAMAALLVSIAVMGVLMSMAVPAWRHANQRENEEELVFRGEQYARAVALFQRKYANAYPPNVDVLIEQKFLRKKYKDPITGEDFMVLHQLDVAQPQQGPGSARQQAARQGTQQTMGARTGVTAGLSTGVTGTGELRVGPRGGVVGVRSQSEEQSIKLYNGRNYYNEWFFVHVQAAGSPGAVPGMGGGRGGGTGQRGQGQGGMPVQGRPGGERGGETMRPPGGTGQPPNQRPRGGG
jgi:type II secretory pathway pseudopilin PulG